MGIPANQGSAEETLIAIDPGPTESAWIEYGASDGRVVQHAKHPNDVLHRMLCRGYPLAGTKCVIEMIACYGMAVGAEVFETAVWIGRFMDAASRGGAVPDRLIRRDVKMHLCGNNTAKDSNIRQALIDRFGPGKEKAVGTKKSPGPLYGVKGDEWQALALAVTFAETRLGKDAQRD